MGRASAAAAWQRLDALDLFAGLLINGCVAGVDVPVQARVRVVLVFSGWVRWMRGRLSKCPLGSFPFGPDVPVCSGRRRGLVCLSPILPLDYHLYMVYGYCMVKYLQANEERTARMLTVATTGEKVREARGVRCSRKGSSRRNRAWGLRA